MKKQVNRREFITKATLSLIATGLAPLSSLELAQDLARKYLPIADAEPKEPPRRIIEIGLRSGVPLIYLASGKEFKDLSQPRFPNCPYNGNGLTDVGNNLHLNTHTMALSNYAANIAFTQGIENESGHTALFAHRKGGATQNKVTPIIANMARNTTNSLVNGAQFGTTVTNNTLGNPDLQMVNNSTFFEYFKKPTLKVSESEADIIAKASRTLSRKQALLLERAQKNALPHANSHSSAVYLMTTDFSQLLGLDDLPTALTSGRKAMYAEPAMSLAMGLKAMSLNLINSTLVCVNTGDWHRYQAIGDNRDFPQEMSIMLSETIGYLQRTPDPASPSGETLWDSTLIVIGTEFSRGISPIGRDNNDGATQGIALIGQRVRGGYYGGFDLPDVANQPGVPCGFDLATGVSTPGSKVTNEQAYHTVNALLGNSGTDLKKVFRCMLA